MYIVNGLEPADLPFTQFLQSTPAKLCPNRSQTSSASSHVTTYMPSAERQVSSSTNLSVRSQVSSLQPSYSPALQESPRPDSGSVDTRPRCGLCRHFVFSSEATDICGREDCTKIVCDVCRPGVIDGWARNGRPYNCPLCQRLTRACPTGAEIRLLNESTRRREQEATHRSTCPTGEVARRTVSTTTYFMLDQGLKCTLTIAPVARNLPLG